MSDEDIQLPEKLEREERISNPALRKRERENRLAGMYEAEEIFAHLMQRLKYFEGQLEENEEIGLKLANFGEASEIHIRAISFQNPHLIVFDGVNSKGHEVSLVQHVSQLNFMLIAMAPFKEEPYRVGFILDEDMEDGEKA